MSDANQSTQWYVEAKTVAKSKPDELEQIKRTVACVIRWSRTRATATHPDFWQERRSAAFGSLPCSDEQHPVTFWCHRPCWLWTLPDRVKHHTHHPIRMRGLVMGWAVLFQVMTRIYDNKTICSLNRSPEGAVRWIRQCGEWWLLQMTCMTRLHDLHRNTSFKFCGKFKWVGTIVEFGADLKLTMWRW